MKTIAYIDNAEGKTLYCFKLKDCQLFRNTLLYPKQKRIDRILEALTDLKTMENIIIYLIKGNKYKKIITKTF